MLSSTKRILFDIALILSTLLLPWWFTCALTLLGVFLFLPFFESVIVGFVLDVLFGGGQGGVFEAYPFTISIGIVFLLSFWITEHLTLSNRME